ncbi:MAG TPA: hypothetical protein VFI42_15920 [Thermomicrobiaceae bacterium]|nr:hypothetical protein [Thermomicrobiaceae bacterium]
MTTAELDRLALLHPEALWRVERVIQRMAARGFDVYVGRTLGTAADVAAAVAAGRAAKGMKVDWHMLRRAADLRQRKKDGGPNFDQSAASEPFWRALYEEATAMGLRSLAYHPDGTKFIIQTSKGPIWDSGHVEYRAPHATLAAAVAAELPRAEVA